MDETMLGHTIAFWSAVGSIVNAVVVIALAVINGLYLSAARRQAKAAEAQAKAATTQAEAAKQSAAALQSAQKLVEANENKVMRAGIEQTLRFVSGLRESFSEGSAARRLSATE